MKIIFDAFECGANHIAADTFVAAIVVITVGVVVVNVGTANVIVIVARTGIIIIIFDLNAFGFITTILEPNFHLCC